MIWPAFLSNAPLGALRRKDGRTPIGELFLGATSWAEATAEMIAALLLSWELR